MGRLVSTEDYQRKALKKLPRIIADYLEGGALDEVTARSNTHDLQELRLQQRIMRDVSDIDVSTTVLGKRIDAPVMVSPMGLLPLFHPDGEIGTARAAHACGTVFVHSAWSGAALDDVAAAAPGSVWAQVNLWRDERLVDRRLEQAAAAGVDVLVLAGDVAAAEKRERDLHNGFGYPFRPTVRGALNAARKVAWLRNLVFGQRLTFGDQTVDNQPLSLPKMIHFLEENETSSMTWRDVSRLCARWPGKVAIKGVMSVGDAQAAVDAGVDAVYVSNHGGRQFDAQPSTTCALRRIVDAVGNDVEILVDGGIRRGGDAVKLRALGATACLIGRPAVYGLAVGGQTGVAAIISLLTQEAATSVAFVGATALSDIDSFALFGEPRGGSNSIESYVSRAAVATTDAEASQGSEASIETL